MRIRWAQVEDVAIVQSFWAQRGQVAPPFQYLYPQLAVAESDGVLLASLAIHMDVHGHVAYLAYLTANPKADVHERSEALDGVVAFLEAEAKSRGYKILGCFTDSLPVVTRLEGHHYQVCEQGYTLLMKGI